MNAPWHLVAVYFLAPLSWSGLVAVADEPKPRAEPAEAYRRHGLDPATSLESRVKVTPPSVLEMFREADRPSPTTHALTEAERLKLKVAIEALPPLHRSVLGERLRVVSFLDGMPNTALTSTVNPEEPFRLFDITINASILGQNVSEWLTQKERTCFDGADSPLSVVVDAGTRIDALAYVVLHEATHIVDSSLRITPVSPDAARAPRAEDAPGSPFIDGVWSELALPAPRYRDPLRARVRFYNSGAAIPIHEAQAVYESLSRTPFASLYGGRNWLDDLAEFVTVYHLTEVMKQPYRIVIRKGGSEVFAYEPMKSALVRGRFGEMKRYYP